MVAEVALNKAVFTGNCEIEQLYQFFRALGTPTKDVWPGVCRLEHYNEKTFPKWKPNDAVFNEIRQKTSTDCEELIRACLTYDPECRPSAFCLLADFSYLQKTPEDYDYFVSVGDQEEEEDEEDEDDGMTEMDEDTTADTEAETAEKAEKAETAETAEKKGWRWFFCKCVK